MQLIKTTRRIGNGGIVANVLLCAGHPAGNKGTVVIHGFEGRGRELNDQCWCLGEPGFPDSIDLK